MRSIPAAVIFLILAILQSPSPAFGADRENWFVRGDVVLGATQESKTRAIAMTLSLSPRASSCPREALLGILKAAHQSTAPRKEIYLYTQGYGFFCPDQDRDDYLRALVEEVVTANTQGIPIHMRLSNPVIEEWLRELCDRTGGSCR